MFEEQQEQRQHDRSAESVLLDCVLLLQDTGEGRNKTDDNSADSAQGVKTLSGECIRGRMTGTTTDTTNDNKQDEVLRSKQHHLINSN